MSYHPMASDRLAPAPYLQASSQYGSSAPNLYEHFLSQSFVVNGHFLQDIANAIGSSAPSTWEHFEAGALPSDAAKLARQQIILCFLNEGRQHAKKAAERARETGNNSYMLYSHYDNVTPVLGSLRPCRHSPEHPPSFTVHIIFRRGGTHDPDHLHYASIELLRAHDHKQHIYTMCLAATGGNWTGRDVQAIFDNALLTAFLFVQDGIPFHIQSALRDTLKQRHDRTTLPIYNWRPQFSDRDGAQHPTVPPSYASPAFTSTAVPSYFHLPPTPNPIPIQPRPAPEQPKSFKPTRSHYRHLADFYHKHKEMNTSGNSSGLSDLERAEIAAHLTRTDDSRGPFPEQRVQEYFDNRSLPGPRQSNSSARKSRQERRAPPLTGAQEALLVTLTADNLYPNVYQQAAIVSRVSDKGPAGESYNTDRLKLWLRKRRAEVANLSTQASSGATGSRA